VTAGNAGKLLTVEKDTEHIQPIGDARNTKNECKHYQLGDRNTMNDEEIKQDVKRLKKEEQMFTAFIQGYMQSTEDFKDDIKFEDEDELRNHLRKKFDPEAIL